jgi:hypothetical protein
LVYWLINNGTRITSWDSFTATAGTRFNGLRQYLYHYHEVEAKLYLFLYFSLINNGTRIPSWDSFTTWGSTCTTTTNQSYIYYS